MAAYVSNVEIYVRSRTRRVHDTRHADDFNMRLFFILLDDARLHLYFSENNSYL